MKLLVLCVLLVLLGTAVCQSSDDVSQMAVMKKVYETLFYAYTGTGGTGAVLPGLPPGRGPEQTFLHIASPGVPVHPELYANPWSPSNPTGSTEATENFSALVDMLPALSVPFETTGSIEDMYSYLVTGEEVTEQTVTEVQRAKFEHAQALLEKNGTDYNELGQPITVKMDSDMYSNYLRKRQAYSDALASYLGLYFQYDMSKPEDQLMWSRLGPFKFTPVKQAWDDFQTAKPGIVEEALATVSQFQSSSVKKTLQQAKFSFDNEKRASVKDPARTYHASYAVPANWFAAAAGNWASVSINFNTTTEDTSSHFTNFGGGGMGAIYYGGLWTFGGKFGYSSASNRSHASVEQLSISFDFQRVEIKRPWLHESLFSLQGYRVGGFPALSFSTGKIDENNKGRFPVLPTSFVTVKNVKISASWTEKDTSYMTHALQAGGFLGYNCFDINGAYADGSTDSSLKASFDGRTLSIPGIQIVGFISRLVDACPPVLDSHVTSN